MVDYFKDFEMIGKLQVGEHIRETQISFTKNFEFEAFISAIDMEYDSEGAIFLSCFYKIDRPQFKLVNKSGYGEGTDFKQDI